MSSVPGATSLPPTISIGTDAGSISVDDALLLVQIDRVRLCEMQLTDQINSIRSRNEQMKKLNEDRKSTRLNSSHVSESRMPSSA